MLNVDPPGHGHYATSVDIPARSLPCSPFVRQPEGDVLAVTLRLAPSDGSWIEDLRQRAQVVWATTWEDLANEVIAPARGIAPLEVGVRAQEHPPRFGYVRNGNSDRWKCEALARRFPRRHVVLVDDGSSWTPATGAACLSIRPHATEGLAPWVRTRIERFVERYQPEEEPT